MPRKIATGVESQGAIVEQCVFYFFRFVIICVGISGGGVNVVCGGGGGVLLVGQHQRVLSTLDDCGAMVKA